MSDEEPRNVPPQYPGQVPPEQPHQPNWGSAYPPPAYGQQPPQYPPPQYPPGYGYQPYAQAPPKHPSATTAMVLGIVGVAAGMMCWLPLLAAPFAWFTGSKAVRDIDASNGTLSGRSEANAGKILGIIGTVILALAIAVVILLIVLTITVDGFWDDDYDDGYYGDAVRVALAMLRR